MEEEPALYAAPKDLQPESMQDSMEDFTTADSLDICF